MIKLLNIEALKLQRNRPFWILLGLFVVSVFGIGYLVADLTGNTPLNIISFPGVWQQMSYVCSFMLIIPGMIIIMHTCAEYTYRTHRQNIIDGLSRKQYITTKIMFVVALALLSTVLTFLSAFFIGLMSDSAISFSQFKYIGYFFVQSLSYISLAFLLAVLFKKSALTIGVFFLYSLIFENILENRLNKLLKIGDLLPLASADHLIPSPFISFADSSHSEYTYLVFALLWVALFYVFCYYKYEKQDL